MARSKLSGKADRGSSKRSSKAPAPEGDPEEEEVFAPEDDEAAEGGGDREHGEDLADSTRMQMIDSELPEFVNLITEIRERVSELQERVNPIVDLISASRQSVESSDEVVQYLHVKQQLLLAYCTNIVFYMLLKAEGVSVRTHPVMKRLLEIRYAIEKLRPIDGKLKYQIDRLLKQSSSEEGTDALSSSSRPNPRALLDEDDEMDESSAPVKKGGRTEGVYRAPRLSAMPYKDEESTSDKRQEKLEKKKKRIKNSEIFEALREEFGSAPEVTSSTGVSADTVEQKRLEEEADERRNFEEDRFVRLTMSRKEKKDVRRREKEASRFDTVDKFGDIGDFEEVNGLVGAAVVAAAGTDVVRKKGFNDAAVEKAMRALQEPGMSRSADLDSFASMLDAGPEKKKARRRAAESSINYDVLEQNAEEVGLLEAFSKRKKDTNELSTSKYTAEPKSRGKEDDGGLRSASHEIMKNKGITPLRKKDSKSPRVKRR